jgi:acyl carrier protein
MEQIRPRKFESYGVKTGGRGTYITYRCMDLSSDPGQPAFASPDADASGRALIALINDFLNDLHPGRAAALRVSPSSRLERDLGIDSLARTELALRIERSFRVRLPGTAIGEVETVRDLLHVLEQAHPAVDTGREATAKPILPAVSAAAEAQTLVEALEWHAAHHPDRLHLTVLADDTSTLAAMTYRELAEAARGAAQSLIDRDIAPGDRIALMLPTGFDFFVAFFAILYAGAVPVPIYPPLRLSLLEEHLRRQAGILRNAGARILITVPEGRRVATLLKSQVESMMAIETVSGLSPPPYAAPQAGEGREGARDARAPGEGQGGGPSWLERPRAMAASLTRNLHAQARRLVHPYRRTGRSGVVVARPAACGAGGGNRSSPHSMHVLYAISG